MEGFEVATILRSLRMAEKSIALRMGTEWTGMPLEVSLSAMHVDAEPSTATSTR